MKNNLFYAMIAASFLMVGCGSSDTAVASTTGASVTGKAGEVVSSTPVEIKDTVSNTASGSDTGK